MLSRLPFIVAVFMLLLASPPPGLAQEKDVDEGSMPIFSFKTGDREPLFGDRFTLKAGYKVWVAKWQAPVNALATNGPVHATADHASAMHGPTLSGSLKLRESEWFNSMFVSVTSLRDGFDFEERGTLGNRNHDFANRRDTTITAGLAIWEGFGLFGGYYTSDQDFTSLFNGSLQTRNKRNLQGPIFGVFGNAPISERASVYGNLAYALLQLSSGTKPAGTLPGLTGPSLINTNSAHGYATEFGLNLTGPRIWKIGTELQLGFRAQIINKTLGRLDSGGTTLPSGTILNDITYGPTFAINAVF